MSDFVTVQRAQINTLKAVFAKLGDHAKQNTKAKAYFSELKAAVDAFTDNPPSENNAQPPRPTMVTPTLILDKLEEMSRTINEMRSTQLEMSLSDNHHHHNTSQNPTPPPPMPPARPTPRASVPSEITISLRKTDKKSPIRGLSPEEITVKVTTALHDAPVPALRDINIRGVRKTKNGNIVVCAHSEGDAEKILAHSSEWVKLLEPTASIDVRTVSIVADFVPTNFDPKSANTIHAIFRSNPGIFRQESSIQAVSWLTKIETKKFSSLRISTTDVKAADDLIYGGLSINGAMYPVRKFTPSAAQELCYKCQKLGHQARACPDDQASTCARCAGPHATSTCACPLQNDRCSSMRTCTHVPIKCANCGGQHKSFAKTCPYIQEAQARLDERFLGRSIYFDESRDARAVGRT